VTDLHPHRYPKHADPEKGQVLGGECNRTVCKAHGAIWFNIETRGFYCKRDAWAINEDPFFGEPLCIEVEEKPSLEEMDRLHTEFYERARKRRA